ncbi:hypothetical protein U9M48_044576 [Paspalum notatum var. saurae]|uniref:Uncharacterized protein n=1 Tax=Paspalum notatum var. saurae TaxID=547442 RepID=A0AAQ3UXD7_PASNO
MMRQRQPALVFFFLALMLCAMVLCNFQAALVEGRPSPPPPAPMAARRVRRGDPCSLDPTVPECSPAPPVCNECLPPPPPPA